MVGKLDLKELLEKYNVNADVVIGNNDNILTYGEYQEIDKVLDYLINELKVKQENIEKCPSILYYNISAIKDNVKFLNGKLPFYIIEDCLSILSTEPWQLEETYNYVFKNYGKEAFTKTTSILNVSVCRIKDIEKLDISLKDKFDNLSIAIGRNTIAEIQKLLNSEEYKQHPEMFTSTVLAHATLTDIQEILDSEEYKQHSEMFTSTVLARATITDIQEILNSEEYKQHPDMFTSQVLAYATLTDIQKILNSEEYKQHPEMFTSTVLAHATLKDIQEILNSEEYKQHPEIFSSQVLAYATLKDIQEILNSEEYKQHSELFTSEVLAHATLTEIKKILNLPYWQDEKFKQLLTPSIVAKSKVMIIKMPKQVKMAQYYKIEKFINTNYLLKSPSQNYALIQYLLNNNLSLIIDEKLHPIFSYQPGAIKKRFGVDLKELIIKYPYNEEIFEISDIKERRI